MNCPFVDPVTPAQESVSVFPRSSIAQPAGAHLRIVISADVVRSKAAWAYPDPTAPFAMIRDYVAFYAGAMDACLIDGERMVPQPGGFYGGWITSRVSGPFKGVPGSHEW